MRNETIHQYLLRRLEACVGIHSQIALEAGVSQATMSRIYRRKCSPRLDAVDPILAWFDKHDRAAGKASAPRFTRKAGRVSRRAGAAAAGSIGQ